MVVPVFLGVHQSPPGLLMHRDPCLAAARHARFHFAPFEDQAIARDPRHLDIDQGRNDVAPVTLQLGLQDLLVTTIHGAEQEVALHRLLRPRQPAAAFLESINGGLHTDSLYSVLCSAPLDIGLLPIFFQQARKKRLGISA